VEKYNENHTYRTDTYERFDIYEISKQNIQLNDNFAETYNPIYDTIITAY
jgi:hypothetical protein